MRTCYETMIVVMRRLDLISVLCTTVVISTALIQQSTVTTPDPSSSSEEIVCQSKYFKAKCSFPDEVILVERARYGRMNLSKCVRENFGYIGCSNDVLDVMDAHCSGRKTCSLRILDENFMNMKPCHEDLKSYLGIEYRCIKVVNPDRHVCLSNKPVKISQPRANLASIVSAETGCGSAHAPWRIQVLPGQRINVTLLDFAVTGVRSRDLASSLLSSSGETGLPVRTCRMYAVLKEPSLTTRVTVCGGERRTKTVYISQLNVLEIQTVVATNPNKNFAFLISFEATGCPDVEAPPGGWVQRTENSAAFGCSRSTDTWQMYCQDQNWIGIPRNCTPEKLENPGGTSSSTVTISSGLLVIIILAMALAIGLFVLVIGVVCLARLHRYSLDVTAQEESGCIISSSSSKSHRDPPDPNKSNSRGPTHGSRNAIIACGVTGSDKRRTLRLQMQGCWLPGFRGRPTLAQDAQYYCSSPCWREDVKSRSLPLDTTLTTKSGVGPLAMHKDQAWRCHYDYTATPPSHPLLLVPTCQREGMTTQPPPSLLYASTGCGGGGENGAFCATPDRLSWSKANPLRRSEPRQSEDKVTECDVGVTCRQNQEVIGQYRREIKVDLGADGEPVSRVICNCRLNHDDRDDSVKRESETTERQASTW